MKRIIPFIKILRPLNLIISFLSILAAGFIAAHSSLRELNIYLAALSGGLVGAGGNIINDFFDVEIDRINRPYRPIAAGEIKMKTALLYYTLISTTAIIISLFINFSSFLIAVFAFSMIYLYSANFKAVPLFGNFVVSFFTGMAFIYGADSVGNWRAGLIPGLFALQINFIREIVKDIEDINGDKEQGIVTFPARFGMNNAKIIISVMTVVLIVSTTIPFLLKLYNIKYFVLVMLLTNSLLVLFLKGIYSQEPNYSKLSNLLKIAMAFGLISIIAGNI